MGFWDLLPLALGGVVLYVTSAWLAGWVIRKRNEPVVSDHERGLSPDRRASAERRGTRAGNMLRSFKSLEPHQDRRKGDARGKGGAGKHRPEPVAVAPTDEPSVPVAKPKQRIESLDFTLAERNRARAGLGMSVEIARAPIFGAQAAPDAEVEELGQTLVLDTAELMKSIVGKAPPPPPPAAESTDAAGPDWTAALNGVQPYEPDATQSFFAAPQAGVPALDLTQPVRLNANGTLLPEAPPAGLPSAPMPEGGPVESGIDVLRRITDGIVPSPGPDPLSVLPAAPVVAESVESVATDEAFRRVAIAHDDIQSARLAFEALAVNERGFADPIYRAMIFGACAAYARPFLPKGAGGKPLLDEEWAAFRRRDHQAAHRELLDLRAALLDGATPADDEIVAIDGAEGDASFAIRSTAFSEARVPAYVGLCAELEARLLDRLSELAEPAPPAAEEAAREPESVAA